MFGIKKARAKIQCPIIVLDVHTTSPGQPDQNETLIIRDNESVGGEASVGKLSGMYQRATSIYRRARSGRRRAGGVI